MTVPEAVLLVCINCDGNDIDFFQGLGNCVKFALICVTNQFPNKTTNVNENEPRKHRVFCIFFG